MATTVMTQRELAAAASRRAAVRGVLTNLERVIFRGEGLEVARANAWAAVLEDRERARVRAEASAEFSEL